jgi:hypothetical protein
VGIGFWRLTGLVAERDLSATLVALIFTEFGVGRTIGAWYFPVASMVPTVEFPLGTPFTVQVTLWFVFPVTLAVNWVLSPSRIVALEGVTVMPLEVEPPTFMPPPQPDHTKTARERTIAPANFAPEDFFVPIISDPLS